MLRPQLVYHGANDLAGRRPLTGSLRQISERLWVVAAGSFRSNTYIWACSGREAVLVDAGLDQDAIDGAIGRLGLRLSRVFCTHAHFDHIGSAAFFQNKYDVPVYLHRADLKTARTNNFLLTALKRPERIELPDFTLVETGFADDVCGDGQLTYLHTPGHTPGSCVLSLGDQLFTGDTIFGRGVGLSKMPGEKHDQLKESIQELWPYLDAYVIHPGHGPSAPGESVRRSNGALRSFLGMSEAPFLPVWDGSDVGEYKE